MANCNECKHLDIVIETEDDCKYKNHICTKHGVSLRYAIKRFTGYIWPCVECNDNYFEKIGK